ncbi:unnamed protein product, partial [Effrenium voratum]
MDRLPKRRKIGGIRQRMAKATANEQAGNFTNESQLAALLLELFAWGAMSPQLIQEIAALAVRDLEASIENGQVLGDLRVLAGIGTNGAYKNKCHADLMNKVEHLSQLPEPFRVRVPFALPFGESLQGMLLPHQLFASLWRDYPETWRSSVLPDEQTLQRFWSAVDSHPQMESHPIRDVADYKSKVVPLAVHGDGVPVVGMLLEVKGTGWHFGAALHALWNAHMNPHLILHRRINLMLQLNCQLENMITEYKDDFAFPPGPAEDFENTCTTMLQLQTQVAEHFLEEGIAYFDVTSKCHMLQELAILARHINPRLIWVFCGEDMMQKMQQVAQSCTRGNTPGQTNLKM